MTQTAIDTNYEKIARGILDYYARTRGVGHSYVTLKGVRGCPTAKVVTQSCAHASNLAVASDLTRDRFITLDDFIGPKLAGNRCPIVFDNFALYVLLSGLLTHISKLIELAPAPTKGE